jgi:putative selenate reductase molybdopterin-binding subunit
MKRLFEVVGQKERRVDGVKLAIGKGGFVDDIVMPGLLHAKILGSPHAHARIKDIDTRRAERLPGVAAVLTYQNIPRVAYTTAGQGWPEPSPYDAFMFDRKVRFVGDRVAAVAAESEAIAEKALSLIRVRYEILPAVFDPELALAPGAPVIHDEEDTRGIHDRKRNIAAHIDVELGNVEQALAKAHRVLEAEYRVPAVQAVPLEPHLVIAYLDEDDRLVVRTSTQVPFHVRRIIAPLLEIPAKQIRVVKPRIGGGFGAKQEVLLEDVCGMLALRTGRPVRLGLTRQEEFVASRTRHGQILRLRTGFERDGSLVAQDLRVIENTGAYGTHALTVMCNTGSKPLALYRCPNQRFVADGVYTNLPVAGAMRGYGGPQGFFALESHMDEIADALGIDPLELRRRNAIDVGDAPPIAAALGEGKEGLPQKITSCGLAACAGRAAEELGWGEKWRPAPKATAAVLAGKRRGVGVAFLMHGSGIPGVDMAAASLKLNDDGSFNLMVGATDIGTGADTMLAQIAAEQLGTLPEQILVHAADTDITPFDTGAYASSTTYVSGGAVRKAAEQVRRQMTCVAARLLGVACEAVVFRAGRVFAPDGRTVSFGDIALDSLYQHHQQQIMASASHMSYESPPPFAVHMAEVEVDVETGVVRVLKYVAATDCGTVINPPMAEGQVEGAIGMSLGYALTEELCFDERGVCLNPNLTDYKLVTALDMPEVVTFMVETYEPSGPFGAKAVAEIAMDGPGPVVANAVFNAVGVRLRSLPLTPEKVRAAIRARQKPA